MPYAIYQKTGQEEAFQIDGVGGDIQQKEKMKKKTVKRQSQKDAEGCTVSQ
jgi:hypothetical protein